MYSLLLLLGLGPLGLMYILPSILENLALLTDSNIIENASKQQSTLYMIILARNFLPLVGIVFFVI